MSWTWTQREWARIEERAREERAARALVRETRHGVGNVTRYLAARAVADGAALELRQWAHVSSSIYSSDLIRDVRRAHETATAARA